LKEFKNCA